MLNECKTQEKSLLSFFFLISLQHMDLVSNFQPHRFSCCCLSIFLLISRKLCDAQVSETRVLKTRFLKRPLRLVVDQIIHKLMSLGHLKEANTRIDLHHLQTSKYRTSCLSWWPCISLYSLDESSLYSFRIGIYVHGKTKSLFLMIQNTTELVNLHL